MSPQDETERFWQAFRYVGEEMTPGEATDFEVQLANDQTAREAVARVVELSQLVLAAAPEQWPTEAFVSPTLRSRTWMQPVGWIAVGAAACLAVVMAYQSFTLATGTTPMASLPHGSASDLALAWAIAPADLPGPEDAAATPTTSGDATDRSSNGTASNDTASNHDASDVALQTKATNESSTDPMEEFTDPVAPAWLLVAVEDARKGASQEN